MEKEIPSPFWKADNEQEETFAKEVQDLAKKHGYSQIFCAFCAPIDEDSGIWHGTSNVISDGMVDYLEEGAVPFMREVLENQEEISPQDTL